MFDFISSLVIEVTYAQAHLYDKPLIMLFVQIGPGVYLDWLNWVYQLALTLLNELIETTNKASIKCFQLIFICSLGYVMKTAYSLYKNNLTTELLLFIGIACSMCYWE